MATFENLHPDILHHDNCEVCLMGDEHTSKKSLNLWWVVWSLAVGIVLFGVALATYAIKLG